MTDDLDLSTYVPKRVMAIFAHPDDIEFSCAGTIARWVAAGATARYVVLTSGDVGIAEEGMTREKAADIRESEQRAAAYAVGVTEVSFLREPDGMLQASMELRRRIVRELREFHPEAVICGDPTVVFNRFGGINHPDHRAAATAAIDAVFPAAGQPHVFEELADEGLRARKVRKVFVTAFGEGRSFVDITQHLDAKITALRKHESQIGEWTELEDRMREWFSGIAERGRETGALPAVDNGPQYAESFNVYTVVGDEEWARILEHQG